MTNSDGWGSGPGDRDQTPQWGQSAGGQPDWGQSPQQFQQYQDQQPQELQHQQGSGAGRILLVVIPLLIIVLVAALLVWKWDDLFGSGDDGNNSAQSPTINQQTTQPEETTESAASSPEETTDSSVPSTTENQSRPDRADLPNGSEPVNAAARANEPTGDFNSVYKSPPSGNNYTSDEFAEAVRDAFVEAYLEDRETDQSLEVTSPANGITYQMRCTDQGSYVHCSGGNNANVYIA
ncbi:hypothetical protein ACT3SZ_02020 [Corynebacterium sp. AOP40-9SA-29]|uniref:hypothetical protein n=1 Tax=Corynebacterium sp. AOP40-9SA-29 TaxID=3457677 RepID=UPI0040348AAD